MPRRASRVTCSQHFHDRLLERFGLAMPGYAIFDLESQIAVSMGEEGAAEGETRVLFDCKVGNDDFVAVFNPQTNMVVTVLYPKRRRGRSRFLKKIKPKMHRFKDEDDTYYERKRDDKHRFRRKRRRPRKL